MPVIYVATASSTGEGRIGQVETSDGKVSLDLSFPRALGGSGAGSNPEQLVAMGFASWRRRRRLDDEAPSTRPPLPAGAST